MSTTSVEVRVIEYERPEQLSRRDIIDLMNRQAMPRNTARFPVPLRLKYERTPQGGFVVNSYDDEFQETSQVIGWRIAESERFEYPAMRWDVQGREQNVMWRHGKEMDDDDVIQDRQGKLWQITDAVKSEVDGQQTVACTLRSLNDYSVTKPMRYDASDRVEVLLELNGHRIDV